MVNEGEGRAAESNRNTDKEGDYNDRNESPTHFWIGVLPSTKQVHAAKNISAFLWVNLPQAQSRG